MDPLWKKNSVQAQTLEAEFYQNKEFTSRAIAEDTKREKHAGGQLFWPKAKWKWFKIQCKS